MRRSAALRDVPKLLYRMKPVGSSSLRYTTRAETRPEGWEAVERTVVSGEGTEAAVAAENQLWNWVNGEGASMLDSKVDFENCVFGGATVGLVGVG